MMDNMIEIDGAEAFDREVLSAGGPVVVTFYADWCGDCRQASPGLSALAGEFGGRLKFVKVEDSHRDIEQRCGVRPIPTVLIFRNGKEVRRWVNVKDPAAYRDAFAELAKP